MTGLPLPFPVAVVETRHDLSFVWLWVQEASVEVFHEGAFPAARLSFDKDEVGARCRRPRKITMVCPEPLQSASVLFRNLFITGIVKTKAVQALCKFLSYPFLYGDPEYERWQIIPFLSRSYSIHGSRPSISLISACGRLVSNTRVVADLSRRCSINRLSSRMNSNSYPCCSALSSPSMIRDSPSSWAISTTALRAPQYASLDDSSRTFSTTTFIESSALKGDLFGTE